jgi:hypothetical protein
MAPSRCLSHDAIALSYKHAHNGKLYEHEFERGKVDIRLQRDGTVLLVRRDGKPLWDEFPDED